MGRLFRPAIMLAVAAGGVMIVSPPVLGRAMAAQGPAPQVLTTDVGAPEQIAVHGGTIYIGDAIRSTLTKLGDPTPVATGPKPGEVTGVDFKPGTGALAYVSKDGKTNEGTVTVRLPGKAPQVVNLTAFEKEKNPDASVFYGTRSTDTCVQNAMAKIPFPDPRPAGYQGLTESHPYAVAAGPGEDWYAVDSSGNDLLRIDGAGKVSLVAVLPGQPHTFNQHDAQVLGLPNCVVGVNYVFESVPTDVEVGPDGALYVTTLPGGPISLQLGSRGGVFRVDPRTGQAAQVVTGLAGAVNLAVGPGGEIYVAELLGGQISVADAHLRGGWMASTARPLLKLADVSAVELDGGVLYASTLPPDYLKGKTDGHGSVVKIKI